MSIFKSFDGWQEKDGILKAIFTKEVVRPRVVFDENTIAALEMKTFDLEDLKDAVNEPSPGYSSSDKEKLSLALKQYPG